MNWKVMKGLNANGIVGWCYLFVLSTILFQCQSTPSNPKKEIEKEAITSINGQLGNFWNNSLEIEINDKVTEVTLSDDGKFKFETDQIKQPSYAYITHGEIALEIYINPGNELTFTVNVFDFLPSINFKGKDAAINQYLISQELTNQDLPSAFEINSLNEKRLLILTDSVKKVKLSLLRQFKDSIQDKRFTNIQEGNIIYQWANELMNYQRKRNTQANEFPYSTSDSLLATIKGISLNKKEYINSFQFANFAFDRVQQEVNKQLMNMTLLKDDVDSTTLALSMQQLAQIVNTPEVKQKLQGNILSYYIGAQKLSAAEYFTNKYKDQLTKNQFEDINKQVALLKPMAPGSSAPVFKLVDI